MSKTKAKKVAKPEEKPKAKEPVEGKQKDAPESAEVKPPQASAPWSDWIWDEALKLYYCAKNEKGDEWTYEYFNPPVHPATKKDTSAFVTEKIAYVKVEEKVIYVAPERKFEVPNTRGSEYLVSVCDEMRAGGGMGEAGKSVGGNGDKPAVKGEAAGKAEGGKEEKAKTGLNLEKSVDDKAGPDAAKQQPQKDGKSKKKDREKRHERKESRHRERRK